MSNTVRTMLQRLALDARPDQEVQKALAEWKAWFTHRDAIEQTAMLAAMIWNAHVQWDESERRLATSWMLQRHPIIDEAQARFNADQRSVPRHFDAQWLRAMQIVAQRSIARLDELRATVAILRSTFAPPDAFLASAHESETHIAQRMNAVIEMECMRQFTSASRDDSPLLVSCYLAIVHRQACTREYGFFFNENDMTLRPPGQSAQSRMRTR